MKNSLFLKDLISSDDISSENLTVIFEKARELISLVKQKGGDNRLQGRILAALFFEPSTRTFSSFITAMQRLGGGIIPLNGMQNTSIEKGESFEHTIRVFSSYADCLVVRHPQVGMPQIAALVASVPVINAGDGIGEHPSQAVYDCFTIVSRFMEKSRLTVSLIGDLKNGRTVHSLAKLLPKTGLKINFNFVSPEVLKMPPEITGYVKSKNCPVTETDDLLSVVGKSEVLYVTRVQKERFSDLGEYEKIKNYYVVNRKVLQNSAKDTVIMHPLPIAAGEISDDLDDYPGSLYLRQQLQNGLYIRMALLDLILRDQ
ncbi:aspartate carbamoyltransferase [Candidatus Gottesmanbacteria bacterium RIFCSPHIGHO2_12_FULL_40_13]|nr:MAG: aspartate carbamoyltransferase [Candidatus Gottesmanbacteria bacterium RIFCSPHIGHO2_12_FULL_40_13]